MAEDKPFTIAKINDMPARSTPRPKKKLETPHKSPNTERSRRALAPAARYTEVR